MDLNTRQGRREQGQRIQRAVERAGFSIEELAVRLGCSRALIYQYHSGSTLAQPDRLQQIAGICEVSLSSFYEEEIPSASPDTALTPSDLSTPQAHTATDSASRMSETLSNLQTLANAQESPSDFPALAQTCERIIQLASQLGDKAALAKAQMRLGSALLRTADYPRAAEALERAVAAAEDTGDIQSETSARQCLGSALVSMGRSDEAKAQFTRIADGPVFRGRWQGTISLGGIHEMLGEYQLAMTRFDEAASLLEEESTTGQANPLEIASGLIYVNTNRRNVYMDGGDFEMARLLAIQGMSEAESIGNIDQHLEARFDLSWCEFNCGRWSEAYGGFTRLLQLARFVNDQGRETMARAWLGILKAAAGDFESALEFGKSALSTAQKHGDRRGELYAQLALSDAYIGQGNRQSEARYHTNQALAVTISLRQERGEIECRLRLARLAAQTSNLVDLQDFADRSLQMSLKLGSRHLECLARCWRCEAVILETDQNPEKRKTAWNDINHALTLSTALNFSEGIWRANYIMGRLYLSDVPSNLALAEASLRSSALHLAALRNQLIESGLPDTVLENKDCLSVYRVLVDLLRKNKPREADLFIEEAGWPPLASNLINTDPIPKTE